VSEGFASGAKQAAETGVGPAGCWVQLLQGLKPDIFSNGFAGTTEVMPCYKARFHWSFPQPVMPVVCTLKPVSFRLKPVAFILNRMFGGRA
jgi:hypothetical protein